jgi:hypothetical protein
VTHTACTVYSPDTQSYESQTLYYRSTRSPCELQYPSLLVCAWPAPWFNKPLTPGEDWYRETVIEYGHCAIKLASLQDILDRNGFEWRHDQISAAYIPIFRRSVILPRNETPVEGVHYDMEWNDRAPLDGAQPKPKSDLNVLETCLEALGASLSGVPTSRGRAASDHASITREQIDALCLSPLQARELVDFVARLDALGKDIGLSRDSNAISVSRASGIAPAWDAWMYAPYREARTWSLIQPRNVWSVEDGLAESWTLDNGQRRVTWQPVWFLRVAGAPLDTTVALFHATIVCQVLISGRFRTPNELILYCVESGIRVSTPREMQPLSDAAKSDRELRLNTRKAYKLGYRPLKHAFDPPDYIAYKTNVRAAFRDPAIVRAAVISGNFSWRISIEHCYPDVALDGPSDDALRLGIGQRFRKLAGPDTYVHLIDNYLGSEVELYLLGGWYIEIGEGSADPEVIRTCWPRTATWESFSSPGWDARKEATYQWMRGGYQTVDPKTGHSTAQPQSSHGWKSRLRNREPVARKVAAAAECYADRFLSTRGGFQYYHTATTNEVSYQSAFSSPHD